MCRLAEAEFDEDDGTPAASRQWLAALLDRWELNALVETAALLVSEVVTNAMQHAGSSPRITAAVADGALEVGVTDREPSGSPRKRSADDPWATGGRGLAIVDALAADWGTTYLPDGKQVWFRLETKDWAHATECRCHGDDLDAQVLRSGLRVRVNRGPWDASPSTNDPT